MASNSSEIKREVFDGTLKPHYYAPRLTVGRGEAGVALCTLWTLETVLARVLSESDFGLRGPLFSLRGAEYVVRNCLANPVIRAIVVAGSDANGSPEGLLKLVKNGLGPNNEIIGLENEHGKHLVFFDPNLPVSAIDVFRENVQIIDLRGERDWRRVVAKMREIKAGKPYSAERVYYPESLPAANLLPSERYGMRVERESIADAWLDAIFHIRRFGVVKPSDKGRDLQELSSLHVVLNERMDGILDRIPRWLPVTRNGIENYLPVMLSGKPREGVDVAYTYGMQFQNYNGLDQLAEIVTLMRTEWYTKRAVAITWELPDHLTNQIDSAPCVVDLMFLIQDDKLLMTAHFRSHDMFRAWLENVYGLRFLQSEMAQKIGVGLGKLEVISNSAHLWQDIVPDADRVVAEQYPALASLWKEDPRGNFLIAVEGGQIVMTHVDTFGNPTGKVFRGTNGQELYKDAILREGLVSLPDHAAYIAWELGMAAIALTTGSLYRQDRA